MKELTKKVVILNNFSLSKPTALISENIPLPNTSSSLLIFILIPLFFTNKNINKKLDTPYYKAISSLAYFILYS